jgi:L-lactate dehydrogenase complex protein LldG
MSDEREKILSRVRRALGGLPQRAQMPFYDSELSVLQQTVAGRDPVELLAERMKRVNALALASTADVVTCLRQGGWMRGYCDPTLWPGLAPEFGAEFLVETEFDRTRVDDYAFGITRAMGAIAETGTIILNDATTSRRLGALAPWVHIAVVRRATVFKTVPEAIAALGTDRNVIWCTGPSKTADVEGILIEGVHGPGVQIALLSD